MREVLRVILDDSRNHGGNSITRFILNLCFNMSFKLVLNYRIGHYLASKRNWVSKLAVLWLRKRQISKYSCDISYRAKIGSRISFPHPIGIVIGERAVIHDKVAIWQNVTLGSHGKPGEEMLYPAIGSNVKIFVNSSIIGGVNVGENSIIGANTLVTKDVPPSSIAYGVPAKCRTRSDG